MQKQQPESVTLILGLQGDKDSVTILREGKSEFFCGKEAERMLNVLQHLSESGRITIEAYDAWRWGS